MPRKKKAKAKWEYLVEYCQPGVNGYPSRIYTREEIEEYGRKKGVNLTWGNGGNYVRTDSNGLFQQQYDYTLIKDNGVNHNIPHFDEAGNLIPKASGKILGIQFNGPMTEEKLELRKKYQTHDHSIPKNIHTSVLKNAVCPVLGLTSTLQWDHKDGTYEKTSKELTVEDGQALSASANITKRTHCKQCQKVNKRFDARLLGFLVGWLKGDENYTTEVGCEGCYWHDVKKFHHEISMNYKAVN